MSNDDAIPNDSYAPHPGPPMAPGYGPSPAAAGEPPPAREPGPPHRFRRRLATGAAAAVLAVTSGLLGGWAATQWADEPASVAGTGSDQQAAAPADPASLTGIVERVQPSVVSITAETAGGSGVVLDGDGHILTNNHVVAAAGGGAVTVNFSDGSSAEAAIVGTDERSDLAVIKVDGVDGLAPATFGDSDATQIGDTVLALGSPLGLDGSVTSGIISAKDRTIQVGGEQQGPFQQPGSVTSISGMLQTDAAINSGNSGGALVDRNGEVIGINSAIATAGNSTGNIGVGFAIPSNQAERVAEQLIQGEDVSHPYLGVSVGDADGGAIIQSVVTDSPAERAGLQEGDVVTGVAGTAVDDSGDLVSAVQGAGVGDEVDITFSRNGTEQQTTATLTEAP